MRSLAVAACLVAASHASAAPVPPPDPTRMPPTDAQLSAAEDAYRAIGGSYTEPILDREARRLRPTFYAPKPFDAAAAARLPDLPFAYELHVEIVANTPPEAVAALARLKHLHAVWLDSSFLLTPQPELTPHVHALRALKGLERLRIGSDVSAADAEAVVGLPQLIAFEAGGQIGDGIVSILARHPALRELDLGGSPVTDAGLAALARMPTLRRLDLWTCKTVTDAGLRQFTTPPRLTGLRIGFSREQPRALMAAEVAKITTLEDLATNCAVYKGAATDLAPLAGLTKLRRIDLGCNVDYPDGFVARLATSSPNLEDVSIAGGEAMTDAGVRSLAGLKRLRSLDLHGPERVTDAGAAALATAPRLVKLDLSFAPKVTDAGAKALGQSKSLADVDLSGTAVTGTGVGALAAGLGPRLTRLRLNMLPVADAAVTRLARACPNLVELELIKCKNVTDASVPALASLRQLRKISVMETGLTRSGVLTLAAQLPACDLDLVAQAILFPK